MNITSDSVHRTAKDWCNKRVCNMVGKTLETLNSTFFTRCCFPYVHFCELYLSCVYCYIVCVFVVSYVYLLYLMWICCILCVFVVSYVYLLHLMWICCILCVFVVRYVFLLYYVCIAFLTLDAGLLARSQYPEGPATGHIDTGFSTYRSHYALWSSQPLTEMSTRNISWGVRTAGA